MMGLTEEKNLSSLIIFFWGIDCDMDLIPIHTNSELD
jgi:hypothetical protein